MAYLAHGWSADQMCEHYPHLSLAEAYAAMTYYFDHQPEVDAEINQELRESQVDVPVSSFALHNKLQLILPV